ncbi:capsule biosynthesis protein capA [Halorhodospira halochloris]|uniref:Capsule biosynthesis protein capA n=2 Tax=Halorhodospira halochloris TaxID=1052 RepID=A0A0X8X7L4_HALHR|nr:CapA family protein [Halorhodospira halochloris]BAU57090.1 capsule biosynthesis protein capA [Halorhodospira halochloris]
MKLLFLGDWCLPERSAAPRLEHDALAGAIDQADAVVINYEGPQASPDAAPIAKVGPHLAQSSHGPEAIAALGVTHASLANNHALDGGRTGLSATVSALEGQRVAPFGFEGMPWGERRVTRLGEPNAGGVSMVAGAEREFTADGDVRAASLDPISLHRSIQGERDAGYTVIAVLHGGIEYEHLPPPHLQRLARWLIDCGAATVITHHPHVPGFVEHWQGRPIAWSLGDLWMPRSGPLPSPWRGRGYGVLVDVDSPGQAQVEAVMPYALDYSSGALRGLNTEEAEAFDAMQARNRGIAEDPESYRQWWASLVGRRANTYQRKYSLAPLPQWLWRRWLGLGWLLRRRLARKPNWALRQLNGLRCETHHEVWKESLKKALFPDQREPKARTMRLFDE